MTDDEIRAIGASFIDSRRALLAQNPFGLDPGAIELGNRRWDYIDPLRMGLYVLAMNNSRNGEVFQPWIVDFDHISHVCTNPSAFAEKRTRKNHARAGDFDGAQAPATQLTAADGSPADHVGPESFSPG